MNEWQPPAEGALRGGRAASGCVFLHGSVRTAERQLQQHLNEVQKERKVLYRMSGRPLMR